MNETEKLIIKKTNKNFNRTEITIKSCMIMLCIVGSLALGMIIFMKVHMKNHTNSTLN